MKPHFCILIISLVAFLTGCGSFIALSEVDQKSFIATQQHNRSIREPKITWMVRSDYEAICSKITGILPGPAQKLMGCAYWNDKAGTCTIIMGSMYSTVYLGHEARHCFEGHFH
jgi:hypothetical protein